MIFLVTDFGLAGPYVGQMHTVLAQTAPGTPVIDLIHDTPAFDPAAGAHLLAALVPRIPPASVVVGVIDPGVGTARTPVAMHADDRWYVGPDNGLFDTVAARAGDATWYEIVWRPPTSSASFHGRDLFAPVAAWLAGDRPGADRLRALPARRYEPGDLARIVYIDAFGNAMTGLRAANLTADTVLIAGGTRLQQARTFGDVPPATVFWYANSLGLAEIAVNQGSAATQLQLRTGMAISRE